MLDASAAADLLAGTRNAIGVANELTHFQHIVVPTLFTAETFATLVRMRKNKELDSDRFDLAMRGLREMERVEIPIDQLLDDAVGLVDSLSGLDALYAAIARRTDSR